MIDITMKLEKDNQVWKWLESKENKLLNAGHVGTHIDVYKKSQVPLEYFNTKIQSDHPYGSEVYVKAEERNTYVVENLDLGGIDGSYGKSMIAYTMWIENPFATGLSTRVILEECHGE